MAISFSQPEKIESKTLWLRLWVYSRSYVQDIGGNSEPITIMAITESHLGLVEYRI